jgi:beta-glucanase (GH16 family)
MKSTMLERDADDKINLDKPWIEKKDPYIRISYFLTYAFMFLGVIASGILIFLSYKATPKLPPLCLVLDDEFDTLNLQTWNREVDLGGFGNGQFEMTTESDANSYVKDGKLYITPTLTADVIGQDKVLNGYTYNLTSCTNLINDGKGNKIPNPNACGAVSNSTSGKIIPPIMSARLNTKGHAAIQYGKVTVRAKLPRGDWLWPAIWMLPVNDTYGPWPMSGEIDIMESRGNDPSYPKQGRNYVRSTLNWGPTVDLNAGAKTYGWWFERRTSYDQGFHDFSVEWTEDYMYMYIDTRLHRAVDLRFDVPFFERGDFPQVITNGTEQIVLQNPWIHGPNSAPFDQQFYLVLNVAVGGTNGWFPDGAGNKPWLDGSLTAVRDFYSKQDDWLPTWGTTEDRSMIVESVKMWQACG